MKSFRSQLGENNKEESKIYKKSGCQLTEFPIIKLHILQNIQILDLSNNLISDLSPLNIHKSTSQHVLSRLKSVDLSNNQIATASALIPLSQAAIHLKQLKVTANPLTLTLNFLYELVVIFKQITEITHSNTLVIDNDFRIKMIEFQMKGAEFIQKFMQKVYQLTLNCSQMNNNSKLANKIKDIALRLQSHEYSILQHNSAIFHAIREFLQTLNFAENTQRQRFESPLFLRENGQIDAISEYKISGRSNHLTRYLSQQSQKEQNNSPSTRQKNIIHFYYSQMIKNADIQRKLLQEVEIEQQVNKKLEKGQCQKFDRNYLYQLFQQKWQKQKQLTYLQFPQTNIHIGTSLANSPFKSVITETSTQHGLMSSSKRQEAGQRQYFGLDREWTTATHQFITYRLVSLHKQFKAIKITTSHQQDADNRLKDEYFCNLKSPGKVQQQTNLQKYLTFGHQNSREKLNQFKIESDYSDQDSLDFRNEVSPKSKNKYIISTCLNNLEQIIKKIVFRKIKSTVIIKPEYVSFFQQLIQNAECRVLQYSFRKIGKYALFVYFVTNKLRKFKLQQIFKKWKQLKKRKQKLIKAILKRKLKKESAFLSVIMTQWRVTTSHLKLQQNIRKKREMWSVDMPLSQMSGILTRSATQHKLVTQRWKSKYGITNKVGKRQF